MLPSEYHVSSSCIRLTADYNPFFLFIVHHDTDTTVNLKNVHMMTDKSNCSQLQVHCDMILDSWWDLLCHHNIWLSLSSDGRSQRRVHSGQSSDQYHRQPPELEIFQSLTFSITKYSLWIHKVLSHICICSVLQIGGFVTYRGFKRNNQRESESGNITNMKYNVKIFTQFDVKLI